MYSRLDRFEKTNEMLINFNGLSNVRLQQMNEHFLMHTRTLIEMKKDLDSIFRRIRYYIHNLRHYLWWGGRPKILHEHVSLHYKQVYDKINTFELVCNASLKLQTLSQNYIFHIKVIIYMCVCVCVCVCVYICIYMYVCMCRYVCIYY